MKLNTVPIPHGVTSLCIWLRCDHWSVVTALLSRAGPAIMILMRGTRALSVSVATLALMAASVEVRTSLMQSLRVYKIVCFRARIVASLRRTTAQWLTGQSSWWTTASRLLQTARWADSKDWLLTKLTNWLMDIKMDNLRKASTFWTLITWQDDISTRKIWQATPSLVRVSVLTTTNHL